MYLDKPALKKGALAVLYTDILFVFAFLPITLALMFMLREPWEKNALSVIASLVFISWGRHLYYALIILPVFLVYIAARIMSKKSSKLAHIFGTAIAFISALFCVISLGESKTVLGSVCQIGFLLFAVRAALYLNEVKNGLDAETDFLSLAVYLISYEFILISPLAEYSLVRDDIKARNMSLSKTAYGLEGFVFGLARVTVLGFALERVCNAAVLDGISPWMNQIILIVASAVEIYVIIIGFCEMSSGLALIGGISLPNEVGSIELHSTVCDHVGDFYYGGKYVIKKNFSGKKSAWQLVLTSIVVGACFGVGAGAPAFLALLVLAMMIESLSETKTFADGVLTALVLAVGYFILGVSSPKGFGAFVLALNKSAYDFDISYALYSELMRSLFWIALAIISITPAYKWIYTFIREKMASNERAYSTVRGLGAAVTVLLLILSTVAMVSAI